MIVHFTAARKSVLTDINTLRIIISVIHESGHVLARDWVEPWRIKIDRGIQDFGGEEIYKFSMDAVARAELVIVEGSEVSFGSGFQVATALARKKPVLVLVQEDIDLRSTLLWGISDPLLVLKSYNQDTLRDIVGDFIRENTFSTKDLRFNFVIDRQIYNHLRWKSYKSNRTKGEIVRELLKKDIEDDLSS